MTTDQRPPRPDAVSAKKVTESIRAEIESVQSQMAQLQAKIPAKGETDPQRVEIKSRLDALMVSRNGLNDERNKVLESLKSMQSAFKKRADESKVLLGKIGYKSVADIDARIRSIEKELEAGTAKLIDEKRFVQEISTLKKSKNVLESVTSQRSTLDQDKAKMDALRESLKTLDGSRDALRESLDATRAELTAFDAALNASRGSITDMLDQKKSLKTEMDSLWEKLRETKIAQKLAQDAWYEWDRAEQEKRREALKLKKKEEREARLIEQAEKELEDANSLAFTDEIALCSAIIKFLQVANGEKIVEPITPIKASVLPPPREVDKSLPAGATLIAKKEDRDEDFMASKQKKKGKKVSSASRPLKLDFEMIDQFAKLKIDIPVASADISTAISALEDKKKHYLENQTKQTETNKAAALERIAKLRALADEEDSEKV